MIHIPKNEPLFEPGNIVRFLKLKDGYYNPLRKGSKGIIKKRAIGMGKYVYWASFKNGHEQVYEYQLELWHK